MKKDMITDWDNLGYPFSDQRWTKTNTSQVHIGRQNEDHRTLCGIDTRGWGGASPEPDNPERDTCYASCKRCITIYDRLRAQAKSELVVIHTHVDVEVIEPRIVTLNFQRGNLGITVHENGEVVAIDSTKDRYGETVLKLSDPDNLTALHLFIRQRGILKGD